MTFLDKRRRAKEQILSATSLLYVPLSGPQYQIAFTLLCIRFPLSACLHTLITKKKTQTSVGTVTLGTASRWNQCIRGAL